MNKKAEALDYFEKSFKAGMYISGIQAECRHIGSFSSTPEFQALLKKYYPEQFSTPGVNLEKESPVSKGDAQPGESSSVRAEMKIDVDEVHHMMEKLNFPWGAKRESLMIRGRKSELVKAATSLVNNAYTIVNDDMNLGKIKLNNIYYIFNSNDQLVKVVMEGPKDQTLQIQLALNYTFGKYKNEQKLENVDYKQWLDQKMTFTLAGYDYIKFELQIENKP